MLLAGGEVRAGNNCDRDLENAARGRGQHFQARGHSYSLCRLTLRRSVTCLYLLTLAVRVNSCVCSVEKSYVKNSLL